PRRPPSSPSSSSREIISRPIRKPRRFSAATAVPTSRRPAAAPFYRDRSRSISAGSPPRRWCWPAPRTGSFRRCIRCRWRARSTTPGAWSFPASAMSPLDRTRQQGRRPGKPFCSKTIHNDKTPRRTIMADRGEDLVTPYDQAPLNARYWATIGLGVTSSVFDYFDYFLVGFLVAVLAPEWHLTFGQTSIMLLSAGVGAIFGSLVWGALADRFGRK